MPDDHKELKNRLRELRRQAISRTVNVGDLETPLFDAADLIESLEARIDEQDKTLKLGSEALQSLAKAEAKVQSLEEKWEKAQAAVRFAEKRYEEQAAVLEALPELLEGVQEFYGKALGLITDLLKDAERIYEPGFEDPPHIRAAKDLGDHEETLKQVAAALQHAQEQEGKDDVD